MQEALDVVRNQLGREYDMVIGGKRLQTQGKNLSMNPARPAQVIGAHQRAGSELVELAMQAAQAAFATWSRTPVEERAASAFPRRSADSRAAASSSARG